MTAAPTCIVGAGLAGLIAAHAWPGIPVFEASPQPRAGHRALLRFRTDAVARVTGIEFRRVRVHKGLWSEGCFRPCDVRLANLYARKCLGRMAGDRSVWALDAVERFVAPDTFYEQLLESVGRRVTWDVRFDFEGRSARKDVRPIVSTVPLPVMLKALVPDAPAVAMDRAPIHVSRWHVPGADVFQTVYFPDAWTSVYRASITGSTLIIESVKRPGADHAMERAEVFQAFGLHPEEAVEMESVEQKYGKIVPLPDAVRKSLLFALTSQHAVYTLGRFATWRNILLDDVVDDIAALRRLLRMDSTLYDLRAAAAA